MAGKTKFTLMILFACLVSPVADANGSSRGRGKEAPTPQVYTDRAKRMLDDIASDETFDKESPFTKSQQKEWLDILREKDEFKYDKPETLVVQNHVVHVSPRERKIITVKLGHTFNTTIVFTDAKGNPWSASTLTDMSNSEVVSFFKAAPHIFSVKPLKKSGQTNLPFKLEGEQYPMTLLFDINEQESHFNVDVKVDGLGDHPNSQRERSMHQYTSGHIMTPKLSAEPAKELMLQSITPEGYSLRDLWDEYGNLVDPRDFMAWTHKNKLYIMTPHHHWSPDPIDVSAASDGRHKLLEYDDIPVVYMRRNNKYYMLYVK